MLINAIIYSEVVIVGIDWGTKEALRLDDVCLAIELQV